MSIVTQLDKPDSDSFVLSTTYFSVQRDPSFTMYKAFYKAPGVETDTVYPELTLDEFERILRPGYYGHLNMILSCSRPLVIPENTIWDDIAPTAMLSQPLLLSADVGKIVKAEGIAIVEDNRHPSGIFDLWFKRAGVNPDFLRIYTLPRFIRERLNKHHAESFNVWTRPPDEVDITEFYKVFRSSPLSIFRASKDVRSFLGRTNLVTHILIEARRRIYFKNSIATREGSTIEEMAQQLVTDLFAESEWANAFRVLASNSIINPTQIGRLPIGHTELAYLGRIIRYYENCRSIWAMNRVRADHLPAMMLIDLIGPSTSLIEQRGWKCDFWARKNTNVTFKKTGRHDTLEIVDNA